MADYAIHDTTLTAIANTIRKKDGSVALIDPADYADRINLMGMLEEKTVSGAIASFSDGADTVACKSVKCSVVASGGGGTPSSPVPIVGASSLTVKQRGKNISSVSEYNNNPWNFWGTNFTVMVPILNSLPIGTYTLSYTFEVTEVPDTGNISYGVPYIRAYINGTYYNLTSYSISDASSVSVGDKFTVSASFTIDADKAGKISYCYIYCDKKESHSGTGRGAYNLVDVMLETGSTATTYEAYNAIADVTAPIGQTVYGGEYDFNSGVFTATVEEFVFDGSNDETWTMYTVNTDQHMFRISNCPRKSGTLTAGANQIYSLCNEFSLSTNESTGRIQGKYSGTGTNIDFVNNDCADVTAWRTWLSNNPIQLLCELETPIEITGLDTHTFETALGVNNFYCDSGDTEVVYRSSGTIHVYPTAEEASF